MRSYLIRCILNVTKHSSPPTLDPNPFRYCGEYTDGESGQVYLRNRYYDPGTGRFTNEDPIRSGANWYAYCGGNPVRFVDPLGLFGAKSWEWFENAPYSEGYVNQRLYGNVSGPSSSSQQPNWSGMDIIYNRGGNVSYSQGAQNTIRNAVLGTVYRNPSDAATKPYINRLANDHVLTEADLQAILWAKNEYRLTANTMLEFSSLIYHINGEYGYTTPIMGEPHTCDPFTGKSLLPKGATIVGAIHSHPTGIGFSPEDGNFYTKVSTNRDKKGNLYHPDFAFYAVAPTVLGNPEKGINVLRIAPDEKEGFVGLGLKGGVGIEGFKTTYASEAEYNEMMTQAKEVWSEHPTCGRCYKRPSFD